MAVVTNQSQALHQLSHSLNLLPRIKSSCNSIQFLTILYPYLIKYLFTHNISPNSWNKLEYILHYPQAISAIFEGI